MTDNASIFSIGQAAQLIQQLPDRIRLAAHDLNIVPAVTINSVPHYHAADIERIAAVLNNTSSEVEQRFRNLR